MSAEQKIDLPALANSLLAGPPSAEQQAELDRRMLAAGARLVQAQQIADGADEELAEARAERYRERHRGRRRDTGEWTRTFDAQIHIRETPQLWLHVQITYSVSRDWRGEGPRATMAEGLDVDAVTFAGMGPAGACDALPRLNKDEAAAVGLMAEAIYAALRETIIDFCESEPVLSWARDQALKDFQERMRE